MALHRITARRRGPGPFLPATRAFSSNSSNRPPFPPPPPHANDPDAAHSPSPSSPRNPGAPRRNPASALFEDIRDRPGASPTSPSPRWTPTTNLPRPTPNQYPARGAPSPPQPAPEDIRRMLQNFRSTGGLPSTSSPGPGAATSPSASGSPPPFTNLFRKDSAAQGSNTGRGLLGLDPTRGSLQGGPRSSTPFSPISMFRPEIERNSKAVGAERGREEIGSATAILLKRHYSYEELGKRLGELRPARAGKDGKEWFSLTELQGRIAKLAELEKEERRFAGPQFAELRSGIENLQRQEKPARQVNMNTLLLNCGDQLDYMYMGRSPQEELLEKYFHPDHMSSEEKMKLELQRVRDEFKMSENDCGSARVQIAQLTLKIKHLSAVLHKKDKHSRKGLQEMVQRRKKYLKYLRRTDWDSYCLVLSKLGLRDVPEYKAPDYKSKAITKAKSKKKIKGKGKKRKVKA